MFQAARVEKFEKITPGRPPGQLLPCKSPYGAPGAKNLGWYISILGFWPKTIWLGIKKPPQPYGLQKKPR